MPEELHRSPLRLRLGSAPDRVLTRRRPSLELRTPELPSAVFGLGTQTVVAPDGRCVAQFWQSSDQSGGREHWVFATPLTFLRAERYTIFRGGVPVSWRFEQFGEHRPTFLDTLDEPRYEAIDLQPVGADDDDEADDSDDPRTALLARPRLRLKPHLRPAALDLDRDVRIDVGHLMAAPALVAFDVAPLLRPGVSGVRLGRIIRRRTATGRWVETRVGELGIDPLEHPGALVLNPVTGALSEHQLVEEILQQTPGAVVLRAEFQRGLPAPPAGGFSIHTSIVMQLDPGTVLMFDAGGSAGQVETTALGSNAAIGARAVGGDPFQEVWFVADEQRLLNADATILTHLGSSATPTNVFQTLMAYPRRATLTFQYFDPPAPVGGVFPLVALAPTQGNVVDRRTYAAHHHAHSGQSQLVAHLYREVVEHQGSISWRDHWMMRANYLGPGLASNLALTPISASSSRQAFLQQMDQDRGQAPGWSYVEVEYSWENSFAPVVF